MNKKKQYGRYQPIAILCPMCDGSGIEGSVTGEDEGISKCSECHGTGKVPSMKYNDKD